MVKVEVNRPEAKNTKTFDSLEVGQFFTYPNGSCEGDIFMKTSRDSKTFNCIGVKFCQFEYGFPLTEVGNKIIIHIPDVTITVNMG